MLPASRRGFGNFKSCLWLPECPLQAYNDKIRNYSFTLITLQYSSPVWSSFTDDITPCAQLCPAGDWAITIVPVLSTHADKRLWNTDRSLHLDPALWVTSSPPPPLHKRDLKNDKVSFYILSFAAHFCLYSRISVSWHGGSTSKYALLEFCLISIQASYPKLGFYISISVLKVVISCLQLIGLLLNLKQYPVKIVKLLT